MVVYQVTASEMVLLVMADSLPIRSVVVAAAPLKVLQV
jgi:hypothetical protein